MSSSFISYWNYGTRFCGIEYSSAPDGKTSIAVLTARKKKGEFEIENTFLVTSLDECEGKLARNQHAFLCITSKQVLTKFTLSSGSAEKVVSSAFPNVDLNEFYYEILQNSSGSIVALCRKEEVHQILSTFEERNVRITGFSLGFSSIQNLVSLIHQNSISVSSFILSTNGKEIVSFERNGKEFEKASYTVSDTEVNSEFLLPLSLLFNYPAGYLYTLSNFNSKNQDLKKEQHQKVFFNKGLVTAVGILLFLLLVNFFLFTSYYNELQQIAGQQELEIFQKEAYEKKYQEVLEKEKVVHNIFKNSSSSTSFYLNQIIAKKPASILLSEFVYQPLQKPIKEKGAISLERNTIRIGGESMDEQEFSKWIKHLEENPLVTEVKVTDFSYGSAGSSNFKLTLKTKEVEAIY